MFNATQEYLTAILEPSRIVKAKVEIDGVTIDENIIVNFEVEHSMGGDMMPTIGGSFSSKLKLTMLNDPLVPTILTNVDFKPYVAIDTGLGFEWIPMGVFHAKAGDVTRGKQTTTVECFDILPDLDKLEYISGLTFPTTIQNVVSEIATNYGLVFSGQTLPVVNIDIMPTGTVRQVLTYIATICSANVKVNRLGEIDFRFVNVVPPSTFKFDENNYIEYSLLSDNQIKISQLIVKGEPEIVSGDSTGVALTFENPNVDTQAKLDVIFNRVFPLQFYAYTMKLQGLPHVDTGDILQFTDTAGIVRTIVVAHHKMIYSGGLRSEFTCSAPREDVKEVTMTGGSTIGHSQKNFSKTVEEAIARATNLITGSSGGHVYIETNTEGNPTAIHIMDTPDINTAAKIWTWNKDGLGYTDGGFGSPLRTAITSGGEIVADFITSGIMNAGIIKAGILQSLDGGTYINLEDGSFSFGGGGLSFTEGGLTLTEDVEGQPTTKTLPELLSERVPLSEMDNLHQYLTYNETTGLILKTSYEDTVLGRVIESKIQILGDAINFYFDNQIVAYISSNKLFIKNAQIVDTLVINTHQFKKHTNDVTVITWIGTGG